LTELSTGGGLNYVAEEGAREAGFEGLVGGWILIRHGLRWVGCERLLRTYVLYVDYMTFLGRCQVGLPACAIGGRLEEERAPKLVHRGHNSDIRCPVDRKTKPMPAASSFP
jgi:hypothetical protein